jgi:hypothetical protein
MIWKGSGKKISKFFVPEISTAPRETNSKHSFLPRRVFSFHAEFGFLENAAQQFHAPIFV